MKFPFKTEEGRAFYDRVMAIQDQIKKASVIIGVDHRKSPTPSSTGASG
jgi:hypothetical protein